MSAVLLRNGTLIEMEPLRLERRDLLVVDGRIAARDSRSRDDRDVRIVDCRGRYIMPGFVNAHARVYTAQNIGMPDGGAAAATAQPWDRLEGALEPETIVTAAFAGALEALRCGTTTMIDLTAAPRCAGQALDLIHDAVLTIGMRAILSSEVRPAFGAAACGAAHAENEAFIANHRSEKVTGLFALSAVGDLDDDVLRRASEATGRTRRALKVVVGADQAAAERCRSRHGTSEVGRLEAFGLLGSRCLLVHGFGCTDDDLDLARERGAWLVACPTEALRSGRTLPDLVRFGDNVALGAGSAPADLFAESRMALAAACARGSQVNARQVCRWIVGAQQLASEILGVEVGSLRRDAAADLIVLNYQPRTPVTGDNIADHIVFGMGPQHVETVLVDGAVVYSAGRYPEIDMGQLAPLVRRGAEQLWAAAAHQG